MIDYSLIPNECPICNHSFVKAGDTIRCGNNPYFDIGIEEDYHFFYVFTKQQVAAIEIGIIRMELDYKNKKTTVFRFDSCKEDYILLNQSNYILLINLLSKEDILNKFRLITTFT